MAIRLEPPRRRLAPNPSDYYPGLTPEERGDEPTTDPTPEPEQEPAEEPEPEPPPLWVLPAGRSDASRSAGFVATPAGPPEEHEGLFDVPGLLERLWLARALEAARERTPAVPVRPPGPVGPGEDAPTSRLELLLMEDGFSERPVPRVVPSVAHSGPPPAPREAPAFSAAPVGPPPRRSGSWVCPNCYLTNEASALACRGCWNRRSSP